MMNKLQIAPQIDIDKARWWQAWSPYPMGWMRNVLASIPKNESFFDIVDKQWEASFYMASFPGDPVDDTAVIVSSLDAFNDSDCIEPPTLRFERPLVDTRASTVNNIGFAPTDYVRVGPALDFDGEETFVLESDGIPLRLGREEPTKPRSAPRASMPMDDSQHLLRKTTRWRNG